MVKIKNIYTLYITVGNHRLSDTDSDMSPILAGTVAGSIKTGERKV
jgi:hypothetical protein